MMVTAPVGSYDVEIQNGDMKAVKKVTVRKDETTALDFSEYQTPATKKGTVNFQVTPANAVMTIDGSEVDYSCLLYTSALQPRAVIDVWIVRIHSKVEKLIQRGLSAHHT